jgi:hypothetical protein
MKKGDYLSAILNSRRTVFTIADVALLWGESDSKIIRDRLHYYVKHGDLHRIRRGFYAISEDYLKPELGNRVFTPSYISFETVLAREGLIFQFQRAITLAAYLSRTLTIEHQQFTFRKIKDSVLVDPAGLKMSNNATFASKERAFLDTLYSFPSFHFDNLRSIDWTSAFSILPIYQNKRLEEQVLSLREKGLHG